MESSIGTIGTSSATGVSTAPEEAQAVAIRLKPSNRIRIVCFMIFYLHDIYILIIQASKKHSPC
jgi:hypothetical protein